MSDKRECQKCYDKQQWWLIQYIRSVHELALELQGQMGQVLHL